MTTLPVDLKDKAALRRAVPGGWEVPPARADRTLERAGPTLERQTAGHRSVSSISRSDV
jgi:hypothetical protein